MVYHEKPKDQMSKGSLAHHGGYETNKALQPTKTTFGCVGKAIGEVWVEVG